MSSTRSLPSKMKHSIFLLVVTGVFACHCDTKKSSTVNPDSHDNRFASVKDQMDQWVLDGDIVGAELLVIRLGEIVFHDVAGWRDSDRQIPMEKNTICRIRSMTKPIVGTAVLMLVEEGAMSVRDTVSKYIPEYNNPGCREITIQQLLHHTGGFQQPGYPGWATDYTSLQGIVEAVANAGPTFTPGERFSYSDGGSSTLAAIVTAVSGMVVEEFIQTRMFDPLQMNDSFCVLDEVEPRRPRISCTYWKDEQTDTWVKYWDNNDPPQVPYFRGSGGVYSTTSDYAKFLNMWMNNGEWEGHRYLQTSTVEEALTPSDQSWAANYPYGYHWAIMGDEVFGHSGSDGTLARAYVDEDLLILYFTQSRGNSTLGAVPNLVLSALNN